MQYLPPKFLFNGHLETIYPAFFRKVNFRQPVQEKIFTPDDDFLELDCYRRESTNCVIISHGLEGNSSRAYVRGMARAFFNIGYDVIAYNLRGCGQTLNKQKRFYHSGASDDLAVVVEHATNYYESIFLIGFSLGGNLTLKYLGERGLNSLIKKAVVVSVPIHLHSCSLKLAKPENYFYKIRFLNSLKKKVRSKHTLTKDYPPSLLKEIKSLLHFDDVVTAPLHGFKNAMDYYNQCSSTKYISQIQTPTLIINAVNDPFLTEECFSNLKLNSNQFVTAILPRFGGHVGFTLLKNSGIYWSEKMAIKFVDETESN